MRKHVMSDLIGKKIIDISHDESHLKITTENNIYVYEAEGDCCSQSWIEHIDDKEDIIGQVVAEIIDSEGVAKEGEDLSEFDCLQVYKTTLKTDKTTFDIEYRNNSNGYYGGYLVLYGAYDR
jgi:hypothetical protein